MSRNERNRLPREDFQNFQSDRFQELFQQKVNSPFDINTEKAFDRIPNFGHILKNEFEIHKYVSEIIIFYSHNLQNTYPRFFVKFSKKKLWLKTLLKPEILPN